MGRDFFLLDRNIASSFAALKGRSTGRNSHRRGAAQRSRNQRNFTQKSQRQQRRKEKSVQKNKKLRTCYAENAEPTQRRSIQTMRTLMIE